MKVIVNLSLRLEGQPEPEFTATIRRELREGQTLDEFASEWLREECRKEHAPQMVWAAV